MLGLQCSLCRLPAFAPRYPVQGFHAIPHHSQRQHLQPHFWCPEARLVMAPDAEDTCLASDRIRGTGGFSWPTCPSIAAGWAPRALRHRAALQAPWAAPRTRQGLSKHDPCVWTPGASKPPCQPHGVLRTCQNTADFCFPAWGQLCVLSAGFQLPGLSFHLAPPVAPK